MADTELLAEAVRRQTMSDVCERAEKAMEGVTEGPWERGDRYHVQGAARCQCRPEYGPLVAENRMDINGDVMLAHIHRRDEPWWPHGIYSPTDSGGVLVVHESDEYGLMADADAAFIAAARTLVPELVAECAAARTERDEAIKARWRTQDTLARVRELADRYEVITPAILHHALEGTDG